MGNLANCYCGYCVQCLTDDTHDEKPLVATIATLEERVRELDKKGKWLEERNVVLNRQNHAFEKHWVPKNTLKASEQRVQELEESCITQAYTETELRLNVSLLEEALTESLNLPYEERKILIHKALNKGKP